MALGDRLMNRIEAKIKALVPEGLDSVGELVVIWTEIGKDVAKIIDEWQDKGGIPLEIPLAEGIFKARIPLKGDNDA